MKREKGCRRVRQRKQRTLRVDFHTHPLGDRYYCSFAAPRVPTKRDADDIAEFLAAAAERGLDAVAVTDHDCAGSGLFAKEVAEKAGLSLLVIPGVEITASWGGQRVHVLAYNVKEDLPPNLAPWKVVEEVHKQGGVAVLAHPAKNRELTSYILWKCLDAGLDGVEVRNRMNGNFDASAWLGETSQWRGRFVLQTAGSDWHWCGFVFFMPGSFSAEVPVKWLVEKKLVSAEEVEAVLAWRRSQNLYKLPVPPKGFHQARTSLFWEEGSQCLSATLRKRSGTRFCF